LSISACVPWPTDTITMTAAMPMITPSEVSALRIQLPRNAKTAVRRTSMKFMPAPRRMGARMQLAIAHLVDAIGMRGDVRVVRDQDDRVVFVAQSLEQRQDLLAGPAVERTGGLVGEQDRRTIDQRARDRDALLLPARQFTGTMPGAIAETHRIQCRMRSVHPFVARDVDVAHRHGDVFQGAHARQQVEPLEYEADLLQP
jgi:hypothetical protein